jgi:hypothetical protein
MGGRWRRLSSWYQHGFTLADAATIPGITFSGNKITQHTNNQVIDGYDFSLNGGYQTDINGTNVTIRNCKFAIGTNNFYMLKVSGSGLTVVYCELYDNFNSEAGSAPNNNGAVIYWNASNGVCQYNYMEHAYADFLDLYGGGHFDVRFNVIHDSGVGGHPDWLALGGGTYTTINVDFNLFYNENVAIWGGVGSQGLGLDGFGTYSLQGPFSSSNNVLIALSGASMNHLIERPAVTFQSGGFTYAINSNYVDTSGGPFISGPTAAAVTESGNINMVTGGSIS